MNKTIIKLIFASGAFIGFTGFAHAADSIGSFFTITPGDDVEGMARIQPARDGGHILTLSPSFKAARAPALYVVLHKDTIPRQYNRNNAVMVSKLKSFTGMQQYYIPPNVDPADFEAVIIWCKEFNVTFGAAKMMPISRGFF